MSTEGFSIIIPTYQEAGNLQSLLATISQTNFNDRIFEVLLVDDNSQDGSFELTQTLNATYPWVKMIVRQGPRGLSRSIVDGIYAAKHSFIVCMDADLSHPMTCINTMLDLLESDTADMVLGSRYVLGGSVDDAWPWHRRFISQACGFVTKILLRLSVQDPLTGFFALKKSIFMQGNIVKPAGWKIALEIMIKCRCRSVNEVAIHFSNRHHGNSKFSLHVCLAYVKQLLELIYFKYVKIRVR